MAHNKYSSIRKSFLILFAVILSQSAECTAIESERVTTGNATSDIIQPSRDATSYKGWDFLAEKLIKDGIPQDTVSAVLNNDKMPAISFIPFKLNPVESPRIYDSMTANDKLDRAYDALSKYKESFRTVENRFGVTKYIIAAIISVETNWGNFTGNEIVFYRIARIVSTGEQNNLLLNYRKLKSQDSTVTLEQVRERSDYLFRTFYPHLLSMLRIYKNNPGQILELKGSVSGAYGLPQFMPKSFEQYALDGNKDKVIDLFTAEDAIYSVGNFLKSHGWRKFLSPQEKLAVLWHYNKSDAYGRAVIRVALSLQNRDLKYD